MEAATDLHRLEAALPLSPCRRKLIGSSKSTLACHALSKEDRTARWPFERRVCASAAPPDNSCSSKCTPPGAPLATGGCSCSAGRASFVNSPACRPEVTVGIMSFCTPSLWCQFCEDTHPPAHSPAAIRAHAHRSFPISGSSRSFCVGCVGSFFWPLCETGLNAGFLRASSTTVLLGT